MCFVSVFITGVRVGTCVTIDRYFKENSGNQTPDKIPSSPSSTNVAPPVSGLASNSTTSSALSPLNSFAIKTKPGLLLATTLIPEPNNKDLSPTISTDQFGFPFIRFQLCVLLTSPMLCVGCKSISDLESLFHLFFNPKCHLREICACPT